MIPARPQFPAPTPPVPKNPARAPAPAHDCPKANDRSPSPASAPPGAEHTAWMSSGRDLWCSCVPVCSRHIPVTHVPLAAAKPGSVDTAWMPRSCRGNGVDATFTPYGLVRAGPK